VSSLQIARSSSRRLGIGTISGENSFGTLRPWGAAGDESIFDANEENDYEVC
jgi:hypothetical protein